MGLGYSNATDLIGTRVLSAERVHGGVRFWEECDGYYSEVLTLYEVEALIANIRSIAALPEPPQEVEASP